MKWSLKLGEWFGIGVHVHLTFALLLGWVGLSTLASTGDLLLTAVSLVFIMALFLFVVLHEYGHALTARHYGIRTRQITLYPIGGVAMLEGMPKTPKAQAWVAVAGPAVNFVLAGLLFVGGHGLGLQPFSDAPTQGALDSLLGTMISVNLMLGTFNLLPALPMDGGRILKALLTTRVGDQRATALAAKVARVVAVGMGLYGLFGEGSNPVLVAIAAFVWFAAGAEERMSRAQAARGRRMPTDGAASRYNAWPIEPRGERADAPAGPADRHAQSARRYVVVQGPFGPELRAVPNGDGDP